MIKGILLGIFVSIFIVSVLLVSTGTFGFLQENIITGNTIGKAELIGYSFVTLSLSFIGIIAISLWMRAGLK